VASDLSVEESAVGPVVRPPHATELTVLYLHGNADLSAGPTSALDMAKSLARATEATVVCCSYRPSFPAALEDVRAAYRCCQNIGPVAVAGERMGAGLAAALLVHLRDEGATPPRCAVLVSALLDLTMQSRSLFLNASTDPTFDVITLRQRVADYAGGAPLTDSRVNPLCANLHGLPPTQILVAGTDPLLDDSLSFAARAAHDRVPVDVRVWPDSANLQAEIIPAIATFVATSEQASWDTTSRMVS
jgi:monoterpene epsilon-lactone hydrolase